MTGKRGWSNTQKLLLFALFSFCVGLSWVVVEQRRPSVSAYDDFSSVTQLGNLLPFSKHLINLEWHNQTNVSFKLAAKDISTSCGCTEAICKQTVVAPGDTLKIIAGFSATSGVGPTASIVEVHCRNALSEKILHFYLRGQICALLNVPIETGYINLGTHDVGSLPVIQHLEVTRGTFPAQFDDVVGETSSANVAVQVSKIDLNTWDISLKILPTSLIGSNGGILTLALKNGSSRLSNDVTEAFYFDLNGSVQSVPRSLMFGDVRPRQVVISHVVLRRRPIGNAESLDINKVTYLGHGSCSFRIQRPGEIEVTYIAPDDSGTDEGAITAVVKSGQTTCTVNIPFLALVVGAPQ